MKNELRYQYVVTYFNTLMLHAKDLALTHHESMQGKLQGM